MQLIYIKRTEERMWAPAHFAPYEESLQKKKEQANGMFDECIKGYA